jgi:hypothetical protein
MTVDKSLTWYLAGQMRGIPHCNFPAFIHATEVLRAQNYNIISPAELDSPATRKDAVSCIAGEDRETYGGKTPGQILARDVQIVADRVDGLIFLSNWWQSRGARLEAFTALIFDKQFARFDGNAVFPLEKARVRFLIQSNMP